MNAAEVLALYDATMRRDPPPFEGVTSRWVGPVLRTEGVYNMIEFADLTPANAEAAIAQETAHFRAIGKPFEWKVFGHDPLTDLPARLTARGFVAQEREVFLAYDLARPLPPSSNAPAAVTVRALDDPAQIDDLAAVIIAAFGRVISEQMEAVRLNLGTGKFVFYLAHDAHGRPVGSGRLDTPAGRPFCGLYAGGVAPEARGQGVYRALVEARMRAAAALGFRYAIVEAGSMSLPILKRLGFEDLTWTQPFEFAP